MLPLLPALLLFMFRGPSVLETRPLSHGSLSGKEAVCQKISARKATRSSHQAIRSLLALGRNPAFARAVSELLQAMPEPTEPASSIFADSASERSSKIPDEGWVAVREGFGECERSRDGPQGL